MKKLFAILAVMGVLNIWHQLNLFMAQDAAAAEQTEQAASTC